MKKCPNCQRTFDDSLKFCQMDGTPLVDDNETAADASLPDEADLVKTQIMSAEEMEKELGLGEFKSEEPRDVAPPSPFGGSAPSWMDSQGKGSDDFSSAPSPFDESASSDYRPSSSPFKEPEPMFDKPQESFNQSPFGNPPPFGNQAEPYNPPPFQQSEWTPPPAPISEWQNQNIGANTPFQPPVTGGQNQTLAIVSLVCGVLSIVCCWFSIFVGPAGLITGYIAKNKADQNPEQFGGRGMALAGMITGGIGTVLGILIIILQILGAFAGRF